MSTPGLHICNMDMSMHVCTIHEHTHTDTHEVKSKEQPPSGMFLVTMMRGFSTPSGHKPFISPVSHGSTNHEETTKIKCNLTIC